ncbi:MAG TPA: hypothetical protein VGG29_05315 [Caulobacteraceae bacterium]
MRLAKVILAAAAASMCAATALAQPARLSDVQFVEASRCLGLMSSKALGTGDAAALAQYLKLQNAGRIGYVYDRADQARSQGKSDGDRSNAASNTHLVAERDGVCRSFVGGSGTGSSVAVHDRM